MQAASFLRWSLAESAAELPSAARRPAHPAPLRLARDRKTRFAGFERSTPGVRASRFSDDAPLKFATTGPLKAVDENDHLAGRRVEETNVGGIESS
jgi:hypothetical protein